MFDAVVIGAGAAGLAAATELAGAGAAVLVVEALAEPGGAARWSGGGSWLADTPLQRRLGIRDSVELAYADWLALGGETVDVAWARRYLEEGVDAVYRWLEGLGVEWVDAYLTEGASVARWHAPAGGGQELMGRLWAAASALAVPCRFSTAVRRLLVDGDSVVGVETAAGESIGARAVLVATGGFAGDADTLDRVLPASPGGRRLFTGGAPLPLGPGHELVNAVGGAVVGLDRVCVYPYATPDDTDPAGRRAIVVRGTAEGEIWVAADGRRFHDETRRSDRSGAPVLLSQRPPECWAVFDRRCADTLTLSDVRYREEDVDHRQQAERFLQRSSHARTAETIEELAVATGLAPDALVETVGEVNAGAREGAIDRFGRNLGRFVPIERPPFFALRYVPVVRKCLGGIHTDLGGRVWRSEGGTLAGCYAAGEVCGAAGGAINGTAEVAMLGPSLFSGRVAGATICADLGTA